jgi:cell wall integrity and stress response component
VSKPPSVTTITVGGTVRTVTAPTEPTASNDSSVVENEGSSLQPGAIAGIVIGVVGGLAIIAAAVWFCFFRRRKEDEGPNNGLGSPIRGGGSPGRMATPNSGEVSENRYAGTTGGSVAGTWDSQNKRRSHLMPVDPRLDPFATGIYPDQNRSRESFNSLQDNQDYSRRVHQPPRVLRAMNPDPDD